MLKSLGYLALNITYCLSTLRPTAILKRMDKKAGGDIKKLFERLQEANKKAALLMKEVNDIQNQILLISETDIFKEYLNDPNSASDFFVKNDSCDGPPPNKRTKFDNKSEFSTSDDDFVVVYTDGACENNGRSNAKAGIGVWFGDNHRLNLYKPVKGKATNNTAEIQACIEAIKIAKGAGIDKLKIITDSQFTINCMTQWIQKWKKNNWKLSAGGDVKNKTDLKVLDELCQQIQVRWEHIPGHKGHIGNEEADRLARQGATLYS